TFVFDAWNRLVQGKNGSTTLVAYQYDALNRRVVETASSTTKDLYYSDQWQVLEERVGGAAQTQYVWSPVYVDALIDRDRDADGQSGNGLEERIYAQQDANWNVTALVSASGSVLERYAYDGYGLPSYLAANWTSQSSTNYVWANGFQGWGYQAEISQY